jgi:hypothetical protein
MVCMMEMIFNNNEAIEITQGIATKIKFRFIYYIVNLNTMEEKTWIIYRRIQDVANGNSKIQ